LRIPREEAAEWSRPLAVLEIPERAQREAAAPQVQPHQRGEPRPAEAASRAARAERPNLRAARPAACPSRRCPAKAAPRAPAAAEAATPRPRAAPAAKSSRRS